MEEVRISIKNILPTVTNENLENIIQILDDLGVSSTEHLELVEEDDLTSVLKKIQARLLVKEWKKNRKDIEYTIGNSTTSPVVSCPVVTTPVVVATANEGLSQRQFSSFNPQKYNIPWESMPRDLIKCLEANKRPKPSLRNQMVRIISDHIYEKIKKPGRKALSVIAERIVDKYPTSFSDEIGNEINSTSHLSLTKQLEVRFDNMNRSNIINVLKRKSINENSNKTKKIKESDSYGCISFQPDMPITETRETQKNKCQEMINMFSSNHLPVNEYRELLKATYYSIRTDINSGKHDLNYITTQWPLLFTKEGFLDHFKELVGVDIEEKLILAISKIGITIITYFLEEAKVKPSHKENFTKLIEQIKSNAVQKEDMYTWPILISLLMTYFEEDIDVLFIFVEIASSLDEIEKLIPITPCLVCYGDDMRNLTSFMLAVDRKIIIQNIKSFEDGLAFLFSSFYCLNVEYPATASTTLEFIQRCFLDINPPKGSKSASSKRVKGVEPKIISLKKKITDFEWHLK